MIYPQSKHKIQFLWFLTHRLMLTRFTKDPAKQKGISKCMLSATNSALVFLEPSVYYSKRFYLKHGECWNRIFSQRSIVGMWHNVNYKRVIQEKYVSQISNGNIDATWNAANAALTSSIAEHCRYREMPFGVMLGYSLLANSRCPFGIKRVPKICKCLYGKPLKVVYLLTFPKAAVFLA